MQVSLNKINNISFKIKENKKTLAIKIVAAVILPPFGLLWILQRTLNYVWIKALYLKTTSRKEHKLDDKVKAITFDTVDKVCLSGAQVLNTKESEGG